MHSQIPHVDFTRTRTCAFWNFGPWTYHSSFFGRVIALLPVDFWEGDWNFLLQTTERVLLKNENSVSLSEWIDCKGKKCILVRGENDDNERNFSFEIIEIQYGILKVNCSTWLTLSSAGPFQE